MLERVFPAEVAGDVPCITLRGDRSVQIEQHQGLVTYQAEEVAFRTAAGLVTIRGTNLAFQVYNAQEAQVMGEIDAVTITRKGGGGR